MSRELMTLAAALAAALLLAVAFSSSGGASAHGPRAAAPALLALASSRTSAPATPCSVEGGGCVSGCTIPVATRIPAPAGGGACASESRVRPCLELVAAAAVRRPGPAFCSAPRGELLKRPRAAPARPRRH